MQDKYTSCAFCGKHSCDKALTHGAWGICLLYLGTVFATKKDAEESLCGDWEPMDSKAVRGQLDATMNKIIDARK